MPAPITGESPTRPGILPEVPPVEQKKPRVSSDGIYANREWTLSITQVEQELAGHLSGVHGMETPLPTGYFDPRRAQITLNSAEQDSGSHIQLRGSITDDGAGLPPGFTTAGSDRLGLQIVRTLISADLSGTIEVGSRPDGKAGTEAVVSVPIARQLPEPPPR